VNARRDNGNVQYGCFATQNLSKGEGLVPALAFSGARISSEQVEALRISGDDDCILSRPHSTPAVAVDGRGSVCLCTPHSNSRPRGIRECASCTHCTSVHRSRHWKKEFAGAEHVRLPLAKSLVRGVMIQRFKANCAVGDDNNVLTLKPIGSGAELLMDADADRVDAVIAATKLERTMLHLSEVIVLIANECGMPRKSATSNFEYEHVSLEQAVNWAEGKVVYCYSSLIDRVEPDIVCNGGALKVERCRAGDILHYEEADDIVQRAYARSEPPSEYVEYIDSVGEASTRRSVILVHPDHLTHPGERYRHTRACFGDYVVVNVKKPLHSIGVNTALIDRLLAPKEVKGQMDKHLKFASHIEHCLQSTNVVVHCCNSRSRTPAVVAVWMMRYRGIRFEAASRTLTEMFEDHRPSIVSISAQGSCPNLVRFEIMLRRIDMMLYPDSSSSESSEDECASLGDDDAERQAPPSPIHAPPRKKVRGVSVEHAARQEDDAPGESSATASVLANESMTVARTDSSKYTSLRTGAAEDAKYVKYRASDRSCGVYDGDEVKVVRRANGYSLVQAQECRGWINDHYLQSAQSEYFCAAGIPTKPPGNSDELQEEIVEHTVDGPVQSTGWVPMSPEQQIERLAKQMLSCNRAYGETVSAHDIKSQLFQRGYAHLFELCKGDMLSQLGALVHHANSDDNLSQRSTGASDTTTDATYWMPLSADISILRLAEQMLADGGQLSPSDIKLQLYQAGYEHLFEQCTEAGKGDMLSELASLVHRARGDSPPRKLSKTLSKNAAGPGTVQTRLYLGPARRALNGPASKPVRVVRLRVGSSGSTFDMCTESTDEVDQVSKRLAIETLLQQGREYIERPNEFGADATQWLAHAAATLAPLRASSSSGSSGGSDCTDSDGTDSDCSDSDGAAHQCEAMSLSWKRGQSKTMVRCSDSVGVKLQHGKWLCPKHMLPECNLDHRCLWATMPKLNTKQGSLHWRRMYALHPVSDSMRNTIEQACGALPARSQVICGRCKEKLIDRPTRSKATEPAAVLRASTASRRAPTMREACGRDGPWLELARVQARLRDAINARSAAEKQVASQQRATQQLSEQMLLNKRELERQSKQSQQQMQQAFARRLKVSQIANDVVRTEVAAARTQNKELRGKSQELMDAKRMQSAHVRERIAAGVGKAVDKGLAKLARQNAELKAQQSKSKQQVSDMSQEAITLRKELKAAQADRTSLVKTIHLKAKIERQTELRAERRRYNDRICAQIATVRSESRTQQASQKQELESALAKEKQAHMVTKQRQAKQGRRFLSHRSDETFEDLVQRKSAVGAGAGYRRSANPAIPARKPVVQRPSTARATKDTEAGKRRLVRAKLARRTKRFAAHAFEDLGIQSWPPTERAVLDELGIGTGVESDAYKSAQAKIGSLQHELSQVSQQCTTLRVRCADHQTQLVAFEGQATQVNMLTRQLADQTRTLAATTGARNIALHGRASTWVKFSGNLSKRNMQRQAAVLEKQGVQTLSFWNQVQDEKCLRLSFPIPRMVLDVSQCRKPGCKCRTGAQRIVGTLSKAQHFDLSAQQCRAFAKSTSMLYLVGLQQAAFHKSSNAMSRFGPYRRYWPILEFQAIVHPILTHVLDAQTHIVQLRKQHAGHKHASDYLMNKLRLGSTVRIGIKHDETLTRTQVSKCPFAIAVGVVEAAEWNMRVAHNTGAVKDLFFMDEVKPGDDAALGRGIGDAVHWCTDVIMKTCNFYQMIQWQHGGDEKSPVLLVSAFDGVRVGRDFERPLQQHSWNFGNSRSLSTKEVWLTHMCLVDETKFSMTPVFRHVHDQLDKPEARTIKVQQHLRPAHYMATMDNKARMQMLCLTGNSSLYPCADCTMHAQHMFDAKHQRYSVYAQERTLAELHSKRHSSQNAEAAAAAATASLQQLRSEMGDSRTAATMELAARRIGKLIDTCSISDGIQHGYDTGAHAAKKLYLVAILVDRAKVLACAKRLAVAKLTWLVDTCDDQTDVWKQLCTDVIETIGSLIDARVHELEIKRLRTPVLTVRVATLCRAAGPARLDRLCQQCRGSVESLCDQCRRTETKAYQHDLMNDLTASIPLWHRLDSSTWMDKDFKYHKQALSFANGHLMNGDDDGCKTVGNLHYSEPDNACVHDNSDGWTPCTHCKPCVFHARTGTRSLVCAACTAHMFESTRYDSATRTHHHHCEDRGSRYQTYGQLGHANLKSIDNVASAADLLHTMKDIADTLIKINICFAEACGNDTNGCLYLQRLANTLVTINIKRYAWGPLAALEVDGRQNPTRDGLNGPETDFYSSHITHVLDETYGKHPQGDASKCKQTIAAGVEYLRRLRQWVLCLDWPIQLKKNQSNANPLVELQKAYEDLHRWLLEEASNPSNSSTAVSFCPKMYQGIAWHNIQRAPL
jgi:hypothetical protein